LTKEKIQPKLRLFSIFNPERNKLCENESFNCRPIYGTDKSQDKQKGLLALNINKLD
jgi:hypothetical protein